MVSPFFVLPTEKDRYLDIKIDAKLGMKDSLLPWNITVSRIPRCRVLWTVPPARVKEEPAVGDTHSETDR